MQQGEAAASRHSAHSMRTQQPIPGVAAQLHGGVQQHLHSGIQQQALLALAYVHQETYCLSLAGQNRS